MAEQGKSEQEPSIEEILASIRQIISDDEQGAPVPEAPHKPVAEPQPEPAPEPDVIELVDRIEDEPAPAPVQQARPQPTPPPAPKQPEPVYTAPEPEPEPEPDYPEKPDEDDLEVAMTNISERMKAGDEGESVFSEHAKNIAMGAFSELVSRTTLDRTSTVTLEDITREMMRPMLRAWIDKHVPKIVERLLQQELERISKRVMDE